MTTGIVQPMAECKKCIICGEYIGTGNDPAVCGDGCLDLYKAECSYTKWAENQSVEEPKPRVRFCWECGNKLWGNHFEEVELPYNNGTVIMHKSCAKEFKKEDDY